MLQKMKNRLKDQRGLTLIELLAVIVILGIIAAIAVPSIMNVIDKSREDAIKSDAIQILNAAKLFAASENLSEGDTIGWATNATEDANGLISFVDLSASSTSNMVATVGANGVITLNGTLTANKKTLELTNATLSSIENATFTGDAGTAAGA